MRSFKHRKDIRQNRTILTVGVTLLIIFSLSLAGFITPANTSPQIIITLTTSGNVEPNNIAQDESKEFVYSKNGYFFFNASRIKFFGVNYAPVMSPFVYNVPESEEDFMKLKQYNFNFIRLTISWKLLQPEKGSFNNDYIQRIDQTLDWAQKYDIFVMLGLFEVTYYTRPDWMTNRAELWSEPLLQELCHVWGFLAERYKDRTIIIGYEVPYAEPKWPSDGSADTYQLTNWNDWLQFNYGSIQALDESWDANTGSSLEASEDSFGNIQFNKPGGYGYNDNENVRLHDFNAWYNELYSRITADCVNAIIAQDNNHMIIQAAQFTQFPDSRCLLTFDPTKIPDSISARSKEFYYEYLTYWTTTGDYTNQTILDTGAYALLQIDYPTLKLPIILSEIGSSGSEVVNIQKSIQDAIDSDDIQAIAVWSWLPTNLGLNDYIISDANRNLRSGYEFLPTAALSFIGKQNESNPVVAIVAASRGGTYRNTPVLVIAEVLRKLGVSYRILSDESIIHDRTSLDIFSAVIVLPDFMNLEAINLITNITSSKWTFWYGGMTKDAFLNPVGLGWAASVLGMKNDPGIGLGSVSYNFDQSLVCVSANGWGDLSLNEQIIYYTGDYQQLAIMDGDIAETGAVVQIRIDQSNQIALWTLNNTAYFYDCYQRFDGNMIATKGTLPLIRAFLTWTGALP